MIADAESLTTDSAGECELMKKVIRPPNMRKNAKSSKANKHS
jgi:hypothetical protein